VPGTGHLKESQAIVSTIPLLGVCAYGSGCGKTTLLTRLIPLLNKHGLRISIIKHAHHSFDVDHPGKDSYRLREAGAVQTLLGSSKRWALMTELPEAHEPRLEELASHLDPALVDLVLVEGFKQAAVPKIEVHRPSLGHPLLANGDPHIIAVASDGPVMTDLPVLNLNNAAQIAAFVVQWHKAETIAQLQTPNSSTHEQ
jgi:molybdopterin-guanine dinucleotide biosynthesis protein B